MKQSLIILILSFTFKSWAQEAVDHILFHNGQEISVTITGITERSVTFSYPGEKINFTKSLNSVDKVIFSSGRTQSGSPKVLISGPDDWEKVIITDVPADVEGLVKKSELYEKSTATTIFSGSQKIDAKSTRKIKKAAASIGAHIVYLQGQTNDKGLRRVNRSIKSGIAYGYQ